MRIYKKLICLSNILYSADKLSQQRIRWHPLRADGEKSRNCVFNQLHLLLMAFITLKKGEQFFPEKAGLIHDSRINGQIRSLFKGLDIKLRGMSDVFPVF